MSLYARIAALLVVVAAIAGAWWKFDRMLDAADTRGYQRAQHEYEAAAELQREANRSRTRPIEIKHAAQEQVRERFIVTTVKELVHETDNLRSCVINPAARGLLNDAAKCSGEDRSSTCGAGDSVQSSK